MSSNEDTWNDFYVVYITCMHLRLRQCENMLNLIMLWVKWHLQFDAKNVFCASPLSSLNTGWYPPDSRHGDVLWLSVPPGPDRGPWSAQDGSLRGHGYDRWMAGHHSLSCNSSHLLHRAAMWHSTVRLLMDGLESLWELAERFECWVLSHI